MKAYQIKFIIKGTKPPVWWRCVVPAGVTFSALSMILNDIAGISQDEPFTFRLYLKLYLYESSEERPLVADGWSYDAREAGSTFIDDYFDSESRMRYISGANEYDIEIERRLADVMPEDLPCVLKWKTCAGGGDLDRRIRSSYDSFEGTPQFVPKSEIIALAENGVNRLACNQAPKSEKGNIIKCTRHLLGDVALLLDPTADVGERTTLFLENSAQISQRPSEEDFFSLHQMLEDEPMSGLKRLARELGLKKYSALSKEELAERVTQGLLDPEFMRDALAMLEDRELELFGEIAVDDSAYWKKGSYPELWHYFRWLGYIVEYENGAIVVPTEVKALYKELDTAQFRLERRKLRYVYDVTQKVVPYYYADIPVDEFCRLCRRSAEPEIAADEVMTLFRRIPKGFACCDEKDGHILHEVLRDKSVLENVRLAHIGKPCYIMTAEEIDEILRCGYQYSAISYTKLRSFMRNSLRIDGERTERLLEGIHRLMAMNNRLEDIVDYLGENGVDWDTKDKKTVISLVRILTDVQNNTRIFMNRGYTPEELHRLKGGRTAVRRSAQPLFMESERIAAQRPMQIGNVTAFSAEYAGDVRPKPDDAVGGKSVKVGPNQPCPCGSGKKYKKCCGSPRNR